MKMRLLTAASVTAAMIIVGCAKSDVGYNRATSIIIPQERFNSDSFAPDKFLAGITIQPEGVVLTPRELLHLSSFFQQTLARSQADGHNTLELSREMSVFKSLDASLKGDGRWREISSRDKIDLAAVVEIIENTQRP